MHYFTSSFLRLKIASLGLIGLAACFGTAKYLLGEFSVVDMAAIAGFAALAVTAILSVRRAGAEVLEATELCRAVDKGDFERRIIASKAGGLTADLHRSVNDMVDRCDAYVRESSATLQYVADNRYFRRIIEKGLGGAFLNGAQQVNMAVTAIEQKVLKFTNVADEFDKNIHEVVDTVSDASSRLRTMAETMEQNAAETSKEATSAAAAAEQASVNVQTVASAAEQLSSSITEISSQISNSATNTRNAVEETGRTNALMTGLDETSQKIGDIIDFILDIAGQTNLLALNATIEAARAGEAGKGFAVVASEVKNLAKQTSQATENITAQVHGIQSDVGNSIEALKAVSKTIESVNVSVESIAAAVEQQGAATGEISSSVHEASNGTQQVSSNVVQISAATDQTRSTAGEVLGAANDLTQQSDIMKTEVGTFLLELRKVI